MGWAVFRAMKRVSPLPEHSSALWVFAKTFSSQNLDSGFAANCSPFVHSNSHFESFALRPELGVGVAFPQGIG